MCKILVYPTAGGSLNFCGPGRCCFLNLRASFGDDLAGQPVGVKHHTATLASASYTGDERERENIAEGNEGERGWERVVSVGITQLFNLEPPDSN